MVERPKPWTFNVRQRKAVNIMFGSLDTLEIILQSNQSKDTENVSQEQNLLQNALI